MIQFWYKKSIFQSIRIIQRQKLFITLDEPIAHDSMFLASFKAGLFKEEWNGDFKQQLPNHQQHPFFLVYPCKFQVNSEECFVVMNASRHQ